MNSNNRIFGKILKWICIVLISLTSLLSTLIVSLALVNSCSSSNIANADSTEVAGIFLGSNLTTFGNYFDDGDEYTDVNPGQTAPTAITFDYYVMLVNDNPYLAENFVSPRLFIRAYSFLSTPLRPGVTFNGQYPSYVDTNGFVGLDLVGRATLTSPFFGDYDLGLIGNPGYPGYCLNIAFETYPGFNCNVTTVKRYSVRNQGVSSNFFSCSNCIELIDSQGISFTIKFNVCWEKVKSVYERVAWENVTYYLIENIDADKIYQDGFVEGEAIGRADGLNDGYNLGKVDGIVEGKQEGWSLGYEEGRNAGYNEGKQDGYNEGWQLAGENKFSFQWFLQNTLNILDVKIFGVFSLGDIFKVVLGVSLVIIVLKLFAGG